MTIQYDFYSNQTLWISLLGLTLETAATVVKDMNVSLLMYLIAVHLTTMCVADYIVSNDTIWDIIPAIKLTGANLCAWRPLEVHGKGTRKVRRVVDKEARTTLTINIISKLSQFLCR
jgi:hypothetical protein